VTQAEYVRAKKVMFSKVGPEVLALDVDRGKCYGLNDTASSIWDMLETPQSVPAICAAIEARYEVNPKECRIEVERLLGEMVQDELVTISGVETPGD
jgi:hypothetical protein